MKVRTAALGMFLLAQAFGGSWSYRLPVEVQNESGASQAEVVVPVVLTTELLGSPYRGFPDDGRDLRVTDETGSQLSFWTEHFNVEGNSTLWVKTPELAPGRNGLYLYWGNEEAESASDPEAVFVFYDGFEEELDDAVWTPVANEAEWEVVEDLDWKAKWLLEPAVNEGFSGQGFMWYKGNLLIAGHFDNLRSSVYEIDPADGAILRRFDMPAEATHTSGIWWDGEFLWACDYNADAVYKLDLEESLDTETASVLGSFETTLQRTSAVCMAEYEGERVLVLSDFAATASTYLIDFEGALEDGTAEGHILGSYANGGASQGLLYVDGFLYECDDQLDQLLKLDLEEAVTAGTYLDAVLEAYTTPSASTQGVAWDGKAFWTMGHDSENVYRGELRRALRGKTDSTGRTHMLKVENPLDGEPFVAGASVAHFAFGGGNPAGGVAVAVNEDASNYYLAETSGTNFVLNRFDGWANWTGLAGAPGLVGFGNRYRISIAWDVETGDLKAVARTEEGEEIVELTANDLLFDGSGVGLRLWRNWTFFDDFRLRRWIRPEPSVSYGEVEEGAWELEEGGGAEFRRGDGNSDGTLNIADAIATLGYLFAGGSEPSCLDAADANDDGAVNIADAINTLGHLFAGAGPLPEPFGSCGGDPTEDDLDCKSYPPCGK